jgi:hypothetical protein
MIALAYEELFSHFIYVLLNHMYAYVTREHYFKLIKRTILLHAYHQAEEEAL